VAEQIRYPTPLEELEQFRSKILQTYVKGLGCYEPHLGQLLENKVLAPAIDGGGLCASPLAAHSTVFRQ
jgi:hypothetical protein